MYGDRRNKTKDIRLARLDLDDDAAIWAIGGRSGFGAIEGKIALARLILGEDRQRISMVSLAYRRAYQRFPAPVG